MSGKVRIGIDIGGTFTDFVIYSEDTGKIETFKILSTPGDPSQAILEGLTHWFKFHPFDTSSLVHGSTVATNALLERKGAQTAMITTRGFKDILQIGRQNRPVLYDLEYIPITPLIPENLCFDVSERVNRNGKVEEPLQLDRLPLILDELSANSIESVAVCFLFSFLNHDHEKTLAGLLREHGYFISTSSEILPEYREYERFSTTAINAYVSPILQRYLHKLDKSLPEANLPISSVRVIQSNGGIMDLDEAGDYGVRCILSGPAGGIVGAGYIASRMIQRDGQQPLRLMTFDMGGTSTDVSLIDELPKVTSDSMVGGFPIRIPVLDIHTIGAGGGSIAFLDEGGALRVGPQSAGADPGPACYGRGSLPTVTDANLVLGFIHPNFFLGGTMPLDIERARNAIAELAIQAGLGLEEAAWGIIEVANAHMEHALRVISIERGYDPQDFDLLSFGGAGGLHAVELASRLGIHRVIVPPYASTLSALGMLAADSIRDYTQTVMLGEEQGFEDLQSAFLSLEQQCRRDLLPETLTGDPISIEKSLDMRYAGQSYELNVPYSGTYRQHFHDLHNQVYGYSRPGEKTEIVNIRLRGKVNTDIPPLPHHQADGTTSQIAFLENRRVFINSRYQDVPCYDGEKLRTGHNLQGPATVLRKDTLVLLPNHVSSTVDEFGNLVIDIGYTQ
jgi:N-methylhydantoinase A